MRNFPTAARNKAGIGAYERTGQSRSDVGLLFYEVTFGWIHHGFLYILSSNRKKWCIREI